MLNVMEEPMFSIPVSKVIELVLIDERSKIKKFLLDTYGKTTADTMDTYVPMESEIFKLFK